MQIEQFRPLNVDNGLRTVISTLSNEGVPRESRAGNVLEINSPACVMWSPDAPIVSRDPVRDANPFFALAESMWMLAGRSDLAFLVHYNSSFGQFSDDGKEVRGSAYGKRWRSWFKDENGQPIDQFPKLLAELSNPLTRRAVLLMWDAQDLNLDSKDVPCNDMIFFLVRDGELDMTVCNRSNDAVYGLFGSNVVHFSLLHTYIVMQLNAMGVPTKRGGYYQFTNNLHGYTDNVVYQRIVNTPWPDPVNRSGMWRIEPDETASYLEIDINNLCENYEYITESDFISDFGVNHLQPMMCAWNHWKAKAPEAGLDLLLQYPDSEWCIAGAEWLQRRIDAKKAKA